MQHHIYLKLKEILEPKGILVENEVTIDPYDLIYCDIVVKEKKLVIEVDGQHHHLFGEDGNKIAAEKLKIKVIESLGFTVRSLMIENYNLMTHEEKKACLESLIK